MLVLIYCWGTKVVAQLELRKRNIQLARTVAELEESQIVLKEAREKAEAATRFKAQFLAKYCSLLVHLINQMTH
jgi:hypothetical protein